VKVAEKVEKLKKSLEKQNLTVATKRSKVTSFIESQKSRQEFVPLLGDVIDRAHVEPLHLKNNACALAHRHLLHMAIKISHLPNSISSFADIPSGCMFAKYVETLRSKCSLTRLAKKVIKWFIETHGNGRNFDYRFTGKDSRLFLHNFMYLVDIIETAVSGRDLIALHLHAYITLCLRDCVALFSRLNITETELAKLKELSISYFRGNSLYFSVTPTVWTLGYVVPSHAEQMHCKYGLGLARPKLDGRTRSKTHCYFQIQQKHCFPESLATTIPPRVRLIDLASREGL
jgi:hypothetical protein